MSRSSSLTALALVLLGCGRLSAQQVPYGQGRWEPDSTGNERAVVRVADSGAAVRVRIPWRRRDEQPEAKRIVIVAAATGVRVANVMAVAVNR
ncbi:MAG TPA: glycoside hydrolase domain-containing protein, partial [Gemmatimonadales bacterium]|nr:glycoside hydrolase domain-containing protein [Gemmatimonadales bacterium]